MDESLPSSGIPSRVPPVEPDLLASAIFLFNEYMQGLAADMAPPDVDAEDEEEEDAVEIDTRAVLDLFAEELGSSVTLTLTLYLRVTALYRLLAQSPTLASIAIDHDEPGGTLTEDALLAASRLDLRVRRQDSDGSADFDPREFRTALDG